MPVRVLDGWGLMALFMDQPAAREVEQILVRAESGKDQLILTIVNWGEIYYSILRAAGREAADRHAVEIAAMPIEIVPVGPELDLVRQAATFKATRKMACADCFAAALAKLKDVELVTGDREFTEVEDEISIHWLGE